MLVLDLADDFLDKVFDGDDAVRAGIFIDDDGQMRAFRAHVGQHVQRAPGLRHEQRLAHQLLPVLRRRLAPGEVGENILDKDHADHVVERFVVNREPAVSVFRKGFDHLVPARRGGDGDDLAARNGYVVGIVLAEVQEIPEHLQLKRRKVAIGRGNFPCIFHMLVDDFFQLRAERLVGFLAIEEASDNTPQRAPTVRFS